MSTERMNGPHADPPKSRDGDQWEQDLRPDNMAGMNDGPATRDQGKGMATAYDIKPLHRALSGIADDDLKQIPVLPDGARLQQGATYIDLESDTPKEFTATGEMVAGRGHYYIPKNEVPYPIWNALIGERKPGSPYS